MQSYLCTSTTLSSDTRGLKRIAVVREKPSTGNVNAGTSSSVPLDLNSTFVNVTVVEAIHEHVMSEFFLLCHSFITMTSCVGRPRELQYCTTLSSCSRKEPEGPSRKEPEQPLGKAKPLHNQVGRKVVAW